MKKIIGPKFAAWLLLSLLVLLLVFHLLIIFQIVPPDVIRGGMASGENLLGLEITSIFILLVFILVSYIKLKFLFKTGRHQLVNIFLWIMAAYFFLNTLGNLASEIKPENPIFTPLSLIIALLALRLAWQKKSSRN